MQRLVILVFTFSIIHFQLSTAFAAPAPVSETGQTTSYATGDDGNLRPGVAWPNPRFTDNANGTVTDTLTGLVWLKNANCYSRQIWYGALTSSNALANGQCGLSDSSAAGDWRLPNVDELESLVDLSHSNPSLPAGHPFTSVQSGVYWSSSTYANNTTFAWYVGMDGGSVNYHDKANSYYVWPVRGGQSGSFGNLTILKSGSGTGVVSASSGTISWTNATGSASYAANTAVTLTATADSGSSFASWSGCDSSSGVACTVTMSAAKSVTALFTDTQAPTISTFSLPVSQTSPTALITLTATDNVAVTSYCLTEANDSTTCSWSSTKPVSYSLGGLVQGVAASKTLYAFVKDAAGLVSAAATASTVITLPDSTAPAISAFTLPASVGGLSASGISITATDNIAVTSWCLTETDSATSCSWNASLPTSYTFSGAYGSRTLYAFTKDTAGNISASKTASTTLLQSGFAVSTPAAVALVQGESAGRILTITSVGGYSGATSLTQIFSGTAPGGVTVTLSTASVTPASAGSDVTISTTTAASSPIGSFTIRITASGGGDTKTIDIPMTIAAPLAITSTTLASGVKGTAYSAPITSSGGVGGISCSPADGSVLPAGLAFSGCGITGTPTARSVTAPFTVTAHDSATPPHSASATLDIRVYDPAYRTIRLESASWSVVTGGALAGIIARVLDDYGVEAPLTAAAHITLSSSSTTGKFSADGMSWSLAQTVSPTIATGSGVYDFYYTDTTAGNYTLTASGKSGSASAAFGQDSHSLTVTGTPQTDTTAPTITDFKIPATANSLTVPITLTASDAGGVSDYCVMETANSTGCVWSVAAPLNHTFTASGSRTLYAFARDGAGNISAAASAAVTIAFAPTQSVTLSVNSISAALTYGQSFTISGTLKENATVTPLAYQQICFVFSTPSATTTKENCVQTSSNGSFSYPVDSGIVDQAGTWSVAVTFKGDATYQLATQSTAFSIATLETSLTVSAAPNFVAPSGTSIISGRLTAASAAAVNLAGQPITVTVTDSAGKAYTLNPTTSDAAGRYSIAFNSFGGVTGLWSVSAAFAGSPNLAAAAKVSQNFTVQAATGYAILIQGDLNGVNRPSYTASMQRIHKQLSDRFITPDNIWFLSPEGTSRANVDEATSKTAIKNAINTWAYNKISTLGNAPLYIIMLDHGGKNGKFYLGSDTDVLTPAEMNDWLSTLESNLKTNFGITPKTVIINGSCYSGSFIPGLKKSGRTIITSSASEKTAAQGPPPSPKSPDQTVLGDSFIHAFLDHLAANSNPSLRDAFVQASETIQRISPQSPLFEDGTADGKPFDQLADSDGRASRGIPFGLARSATIADWKTVSTAATATALLGSAPLIYATTTGDASGETDSVWALVKKPSFIMPTDSTTGQVDLKLPQLTARYNQAAARWEFPADLNPGLTSTIFNEAGTYRLLLYAADPTGEQLVPIAATAYINDPANQAPTVPQLQEPAAAADIQEPLLLFRWDEASDPEKDAISYTLIIRADSNGTPGSELKRSEGIAQALTYLDASAELKADGSKLFVSDGYWWQVIAVDSKGAQSVSEQRRFTYTPQNALVAMIVGSVSDQNGVGVAGVTLTTTPATGSRTSITNGYFIFPLSAASYTLTASKPGYDSASQTVSASSGKISRVQFSLTKQPVTAKPGDCNGDGTVKIDEVQSAINMFLGLNPLQGCVDGNGDKVVGIDEVQKVINSFLGL
jgi:hypothetical protein